MSIKWGIAALAVGLAVSATVSQLVIVPRIKNRVEKTSPATRSGDQPAAAATTPAATAQPTPDLRPMSSSRRLQDGSFNPLPTTVRPPSKGLGYYGSAHNDWRERYEGLLAQTRAADGETSPCKIYVYPFLDQTIAGVGLHCTYGWKLAGTAALALWTDAEVLGAQPPRNYGLLMPSHDDMAARMDFPQWQRHVLEDPATRDADFVLTGAYIKKQTSKAIRLEIVLLAQRNRSLGKSSAIYELVKNKRGNYWDIAADQRKALRPTIDKLIELGVVNPRKRADVGDLDLNEELDEVADLLGAGDSWAVMDGVDRALDLAALFPDSNLPLQAASYGMNTLNWGLFKYGFSSLSADDYALRAYALAQLALSLDIQPSLSQLNWLVSVGNFGQKPDAASMNFTGKDFTQKFPELDGYRRIVYKIHTPPLPENYKAAAPHWLLLRQEESRMEAYGKSELNEFSGSCTNHWRDNDIFLKNSVHRHLNWQYGEHDGNSWDAQRCAAKTATQGAMASEFAALATALHDKPDLQDLVDALGPESCLLLSDLRSAGARGEYYDLRRAALMEFVPWGYPQDYSHPAYPILGALDKAARAVYKDANAWRTSSGFTGFEFSPAERVLAAQRLDCMGPRIYARFQRYTLCNYDYFTRTLGLCHTVRPEDAVTLASFCTYLGNYTDTVAGERLWRTFALELCDLFPLRQANWLTAGQALLKNDDTALGAAYYRAGLKLNPFSLEGCLSAAGAYADLGYNALALKEYDRYIKAYPYEFDATLERARLLCEMGRWEDPEVVEAYALPLRKYKYNIWYYEQSIRYWRDWRNDYDEAIKVAEVFFKNKGAQALGEIVLLELAFGNKERAREIVNGMPKVDESWSGNLAKRARWHLKVDEIEKAEEYLKTARSMDNGQGTVILGLADLAFAKKQYETAISEYRRYLRTYSSNSECYRGQCKALEMLGREEEAIKILEPLVIEKKIHRRWTSFAPDLMRLYVLMGKKEEADKAMDCLLEGCQISRKSLNGALEHYRSFEPEKADEILSRIDEIMAGPDEFGIVNYR